MVKWQLVVALGYSCLIIIHERNSWKQTSYTPWQIAVIVILWNFPMAMWLYYKCSNSADVQSVVMLTNVIPGFEVFDLLLTPSVETWQRRWDTQYARQNTSSFLQGLSLSLERGWCLYIALLQTTETMAFLWNLDVMTALPFNIKNGRGGQPQCIICQKQFTPNQILFPSSPSPLQFLPHMVPEMCLHFNGF